MRKTLICLLILCGMSFAQNVRYDAQFPSVSSTTSTPFLVANVPPNSPTLNVCSSPAVLDGSGACVNFVTTYTSLGVACANGSQDTPQPQPSDCQSTGDAQGNIGFWAPAGTYDYTVCISTTCFGPYTVTLSSLTGSSLSLKTNGVTNGSQVLLNIAQGSGITAVDNGSGTVTISASGGGVGCSILSTNANGIVYLNGGSNCTTASDFIFKDADASHGNAPTLSIGTSLSYQENSNVSASTGFPTINLGTSSFAGTLNLLGQNGGQMRGSGKYDNYNLNIDGQGFTYFSNSMLMGIFASIDPCAITSISRTTNVVTVVPDGTCHFLNVGGSVTISGVTNSGFNGTFTITGVTTSNNHFTYSQIAGNASSSGGFAALTTSGNYVLSSPGQGAWFAGTREGHYAYADSPAGMTFLVGNALSGGIAGGPISFKAGDGNGAGTNGGDVSLTAGLGHGGGGADGSIKLLSNTVLGGHLNQSAALTIGGTCAMSSSTTCTVTLATAYTTPVCIVTVQSGTPLKAGCTVSSNVATITAESSNSSTWGALVFGNPN